MLLNNFVRDGTAVSVRDGMALSARDVHVISVNSIKDATC